MGEIDRIADSYVDEWAPLDPIGATSVGIAGHDDRLTYLSPEGYAALAELDRRTLNQLTMVTPAAGTSAPPGTDIRNVNAPALPTISSPSQAAMDRSVSVTAFH